MPSLRIVLPATLAALGLAACSKPAETAPQAADAGNVAQEASVAPPSAPPAPTPGEALHVQETNDLYEFDYAYPAAAGGVPALKTLLGADIATKKAALIDQAKADRADMKKNGFPYHAHGIWTEWKVVTDLPGWLSLSADISTYEGGAHNNNGYDTLLWDRKADTRRDPLDLFTSKAALSAVIRKDFCRLLDRERAQKRGESVQPDSGNEFDQCIDPVESTIILGSAGHQVFDRIGVLVAPYEAGPFAEGGYDVTLPVTGAVLETVKPEYRSAFAVKR